MSKASEWARLAASLRDKETEPFECPAWGSLDIGGKGITVRAAVGRQDDQPIMCWTDQRLGGTTVFPEHAIKLARWILDTFGETT